MTREEALKELKILGEGWRARPDGDASEDWIVDERPEKDLEAGKEMVRVSFFTRCDLQAENLTNADWIAQGKFVARAAADSRRCG